MKGHPTPAKRTGHSQVRGQRSPAACPGRGRIRPWGVKAKLACPMSRLLAEASPPYVYPGTCFVRNPGIPPYCQNSQKIFILNRQKNNITWALINRQIPKTHSSGRNSKVGGRLRHGVAFQLNPLRQIDRKCPDRLNPKTHSSGII